MKLVFKNDSSSPYGVSVESIKIDIGYLGKDIPEFPSEAVEKAQKEFNIRRILNDWLFPVAVLAMNVNLRSREVTGFVVSSEGIMVKTRMKPEKIS